MKEHFIFDLRMQIAALRQYLRDRRGELTEDELNAILDQILKLESLIKALQT